jgi:AcrR family transcriptional regulator
MTPSTRQKLIETSFELFGRGGFHHVGLDQIIDTAGISKQTFYNHFESKDDLVVAVLEFRHQVEEAMFAKLMIEHGGEQPREKLYGLFDALKAWFSAPEWQGCIFMTAAAEFPNEHDPAHQAAQRHTMQTQEGLQYLATLAGAKNPEALARKLIMLLHGVISYRQTMADTESIEVAKALAQPLLDAELPAPPPKEKAKFRAMRAKC